MTSSFATSRAASARENRERIGDSAIEPALSIDLPAHDDTDTRADDHVDGVGAAVPRPSAEAVAAAMMFGLRARPDGRAERGDRAIEPLRFPLPTGGVVLVSGPSGSGKSSLLRRLRRAVDASLDRHAVVAEPLRPTPSPAIDLLHGPMEHRLAVLARAGLAEARVFLTPAHRLSEGERHRLSLAIAIARADADQPEPDRFRIERFDVARSVIEGPDIDRSAARLAVIIADEFGSTLDRVTAGVVAGSIARWVRRTRHTLVVATAHADLLQLLRPDAVVTMRLGEGGAAIERPSFPAPVEPCEIEEGDIADYDALSRFHYRAGRPATIARVWRAVARAGGACGARGDLIGVVVLSHPGLNNAARDAALGGRYRDLSRRLRAATINREFRAISRVVVDPRWRGCGAAARLVRRAIAGAGTPCVEAIAAMGRVHPLFERAGMKRFDPPAPPGDERFAAAISACGLAPNPDAADATSLTGALRHAIERLSDAALPPGLTASQADLFERETARFLATTSPPRDRDVAAAGRGRDRPLIDLLRLAQARLASRPAYFLHVGTNAE
jgi:hypothetical protein